MPLIPADKPFGEWNRLYIKLQGDKTPVYLNNQPVADNVVMEDYCNAGAPLILLILIDRGVVR